MIVIAINLALFNLLKIKCLKWNERVSCSGSVLCFQAKSATYVNYFVL